MSREVQIITWCDVLIEGEDRHPAEQIVTVSLNSKKPKVIDLCDVHAKELVEPLDELVKKFGVTPEEMPRPKDSKGNPPCPLCGFQSKSRAGLAAHLKGHHDKLLSEVL